MPRYDLDGGGWVWSVGFVAVVALFVASAVAWHQWGPVDGGYALLVLSPRVLVAAVGVAACGALLGPRTGADGTTRSLIFVGLLVAILPLGYGALAAANRWMDPEPRVERVLEVHDHRMGANKGGTWGKLTVDSWLEAGGPTEIGVPAELADRVRQGAPLPVDGTPYGPFRLRMVLGAGRYHLPYIHEMELLDPELPALRARSH